MKYKDAPEVRDLARQLMERFPEDFSSLAGAKIVYCWREKAQQKHDKTILGTASIVSGRNALLVARNALGTEDWSEGKDFAFHVIEIAADAWKDLSEHQRQALVYHELLHCGMDDDGDPLIMPHDVEEFRRVGEVFGLWKADLERFAESLNSAPPSTLCLDLEEYDEGFNKTDIGFSVNGGKTVTVTGAQLRQVAAGLPN